MRLKFKRLHPDAQMPAYAHPGDAGLDLRSRYLRTLNPHEPERFSLGFALEIPEGYVGIVKDRSSLGKRGITVLGGVFDHTYRGEYHILLVNTSEGAYTVRKGDKIAQLVILPVATASVEEVEELSPSDRGEGGFGSTGR